MRIRFLGTGASTGVPAMFCDCPACEAARASGGRDLRTRAGCLIDERLLIDFSSDTFGHTLRDGLDLRKAEAVLFTHVHPDHINARELASLCAPSVVCRRERDLVIAGTKEAVDRVKRAMKPPEGVHVPAELCLLEPGVEVKLAGYTVLPLRTVHDPSMDCYIYIISDGKTALLYGCDSGPFPEAAWEAIGRWRFDGVVLDCTFADMPHDPGGHMGLRENQETLDRLRRTGSLKPGAKCAATHFSHAANPIMARIWPIFARAGMIAAWDGLELAL